MNYCGSSHLPQIGGFMANENQLNTVTLDKETLEKIKPLRIIDDALFRLMASRKDVCQEILRTLLDDDNLVVIDVTPQNEMISLFRGVVLDALCKLSDGQYCNIEMQKDDRKNDIKRVRFHASLITSNKTPKGEELADIPNVKILYITTYDALGNGQTLTHISRCQRVDNKYLPVDDGEDIILANTEIKDNTKHTRLLQLFLKSDSFYDEMFPALSEAMKYYKEDERGQDTVSEVTKQWKREGYEEGLAASKELVEKEKSKARKAEKRAKAAEARAQAAEEELARLKSMMQ